MDNVNDFIPRNYQSKLMQIALEKNTIIFLPTGSGKTFIALMTLKQLSEPLSRKYSEDGKISVILVNSIALVEQHKNYFLKNTIFSIGAFTGDDNVDFWPQTAWREIFDKHQVLILTAQIFNDLVSKRYIDLDKVNLLIFDECHHAVKDQPMRQIMKQFLGVETPPRVLGLTATLLNSNCDPYKVMTEVEILETTFQAKVATVDGLEQVVGFSTNPNEKLIGYDAHKMSTLEQKCLEHLGNVIDVIKNIPLEEKPKLLPLQRLEPEQGLRQLTNLVQDCRLHIQELGILGGYIACLAHAIQVERLKRNCDDMQIYDILVFVLTIFSYIKKVFEMTIGNFSNLQNILKFCPPKLMKLIDIFRDFRQKCPDIEMCGIVFVERRFTAKVVHHVLKMVAEADPTFAVKSDFMVGYNNNPYNDTRESLYLSKKNKQVLEKFHHKETNVICSSNVLEEGIDIQMCTLVVKFDKPNTYRSYVQSKGRARHRLSHYYILVDKDDLTKYYSSYMKYQAVEKTLNDYLIGQNDIRQEPTQDAIEKDLYGDMPLPPYYVDGPNSAQVNMLSAIALVCQYCQTLPSDNYTMHAPDWYIQNKKDSDKIRVVLLMPTVCPISHPIKGDWMRDKMNAKRAAALQTCILLHRMGELNDHLLPKRQTVNEEDFNFLFGHYPAVKEPQAGNTKTKRLHKKQIPKCLKNHIAPLHPVFVHVINLTPLFERREEINICTMYDVYSSNLCYAVVTSQRLPRISAFPTYVTLGEVNVKLEVNKHQTTLTEGQINSVKKFHYTVFKDVLEILKPFLVFDKSDDAEMMLLVPYDKTNKRIDFEVIERNCEVKPNYSGEMSNDDKKNLEVTQEGYLRKIVTPYYRSTATYIVTEVCFNKTPLTTFPNESFGSFCDYFGDKYSINIVNTRQPLLLVKGLSKRLNLIKPRGKESARKKLEQREESVEYLIPELLIKQDFPSSLWIQASFLPTILTRIFNLLQIEEMRVKIARESGLGNEKLSKHKDLTVDEWLLDYEPLMKQVKEDDEEGVILTDNQLKEIADISALNSYNKDFAAKMTEAEYPWKDIDEPKDIEKDIHITYTDIEAYEQFIGIKLNQQEQANKRSNDLGMNNKKNWLALTYQQDYVFKKIQLLEEKTDNKGPDQCDLYRALCASKANEIMNLERLETLGDSFLKLIASLYVSLRFPEFNEGKSTSLKGRLVSNRNLFYHAMSKNLGGILKYNDLSPREEWMPPGFAPPTALLEAIWNKEKSIGSLFTVSVPMEEQISGELSENTLKEMRETEYMEDDKEESCYNSSSQFLKAQYIGDKNVADVVESLLGVYFENCGFKGAVKLLEWLNIIPSSENLNNLLLKSPQSPLLPGADPKKINFLMPQLRILEQKIGYTFKNKAYLLQAFSHASFTINRVTRSYETLEFLGDAVLDFLITCFIYESCGKLGPGELTDLRSALVNNNTFASLVVRNDLHKFLLMMNSQLQVQIENFESYLKSKDFVIDDEVIILIEEDDMHMAEYVDVPKVLGDIFEALAGAIYLDSNRDLGVLWGVFYKFMYKEINTFSQNVPKNVIRKLHENVPNLYPKFSQAIPATNSKTMVVLEYTLNGRKINVKGFGTNKTLAKKAAAKIALRTLNKR